MTCRTMPKWTRRKRISRIGIVASFSLLILHHLRRQWCISLVRMTGNYRRGNSGMLRGNPSQLPSVLPIYSCNRNEPWSTSFLRLETDEREMTTSWTTLILMSLPIMTRPMRTRLISDALRQTLLQEQDVITMSGTIVFWLFQSHWLKHPYTCAMTWLFHVHYPQELFP